MDYNWSLISPTNPTNYTFDRFLGVDKSGIFYASFKGPGIVADPDIASNNILRSIDGVNWTNPFSISDNTGFYSILDTGTIVWALPVTAGAYLTAYLYYSTDHGLTWHAWTSVGPAAWTNGCVGTDGHLYMLRNGKGYGIYVIANNLTYTTWGYTNSGHAYNSVCIDSANNVYAVFDDGTVFRFTQTMGSIYTTLTQLQNNVIYVAKVGSTYLAFDQTNKLVLSSPDADVNDWTSVSALAGINGTRPINLSDGSLLIIDYDTNTGLHKLKIISSDLSSITDTSRYVGTAGISLFAVVNNIIYYAAGNQLFAGTPVLTKQLYVHYNYGWQAVSQVYSRQNGIWKQVSSINGSLNGVWK